MNRNARRFGATVIAAVVFSFFSLAASIGSEFSEPWLRSDRALVIDAYEYNEIDWQELATDERIAGFINKASDGLPPAYRCKGNEAERSLCSALWKRYSVARELYHTRKTVAKALGLKWGAYHLGRPGNPEEQADHFIDFAKPEADDLVAIDIEDNDPEKWMSLEDAEIFARRIKARVGRYPILYTNGNTAKYIADNRLRYPLLSRLPLWYARYKPEIGQHFPKGNWEGYALWQFSSLNNCNARKCPYRVPGTPHNIDVNVAAMDAGKLRAIWPFGELVEEKPLTGEELIAAAAEKAVELAAAGEVVPGAKIPLPVPREKALAGDFEIAFVSVEAVGAAEIQVATAYAPVKKPRALDAFAAVLSKNEKPRQEEEPQVAIPARESHIGLAEFLAWLKDLELGNYLDSSAKTGSNEKAVSRAGS